MSELGIINKNAAKIAEEAVKLSDKLKDFTINHSQDIVQAGIDPFIFALTIFILACFVGYYVVWSVTPALHTPLMAVTNAISGIIIVGAMIAVAPDDFGFAQGVGFLGVILASINIFGGFVVTQRMLAMFRKKS
jgi:NAD(P) transhydrogenase subunit alpha